jgi:hypothetical protein
MGQDGQPEGTAQTNNKNFPGPIQDSNYFSELFRPKLSAGFL